MTKCYHQWEITKDKDGNKLLRCSVPGCGAHGVVLSSEKYSELRDVAADVHRLRELESKLEKTRQPVTDRECPHNHWDIIHNPKTLNLNTASCMGCDAVGYVVEESELAALRNTSVVHSEMRRSLSDLISDQAIEIDGEMYVDAGLVEAILDESEE